MCDNKAISHVLLLLSISIWCVTRMFCLIFGTQPVYIVCVLCSAVCSVLQVCVVVDMAFKNMLLLFSYHRSVHKTDDGEEVWGNAA